MNSINLPGSGVKHEPFYVAIITPAPRHMLRIEKPLDS